MTLVSFAPDDSSDLLCFLFGFLSDPCGSSLSLSSAHIQNRTGILNEIQ